MTGIGLAVLWIGYTSFAYGHALTKGANVSFSDLVLPSHRNYALGALLAAGGRASSGGTPGVPGASGQTPIGPTSQTEQLGGAGLASAGVGQIAGAAKGGGSSVLSGLGQALKDIFLG